MARLCVQVASDCDAGGRAWGLERGRETSGTRHSGGKYGRRTNVDIKKGNATMKRCMSKRLPQSENAQQDEPSTADNRAGEKKEGIRNNCSKGREKKNGKREGWREGGREGGMLTKASGAVR